MFPSVRANFIRSAVHKSGYIAGWPSKPSLIPGFKTFEDYQEEIGGQTLVWKDHYSGSTEAVGFCSLYVDGQLDTMASFTGRHLERHEDGKVIKFLKEAVKELFWARTPTYDKGVIVYSDEEFIYVGGGFGGLEAFRYGELIYRRSEAHSRTLDLLDPTTNAASMSTQEIKRVYNQLDEGHARACHGLVWYHLWQYNLVS